MTRDMSLNQFRAALAREGMTSEGFMGYVRMEIPGHYHFCISYLNAPRRTWRSRLAYLLAERDRVIASESARNQQA